MSYVPHTEEERREMLRAVGVSSVEELFRDIPEKARLRLELSLPRPLSEWELWKEARALSGLNRLPDEMPCFLGAGAYRHFVPAAVDAILSRSEFYTAYTPYQPEVSQGTLQAIYEYQTMVSRLTGMDAANASMYDGASALAEAAWMALGGTGKKKLLVSRGVHPQYREVLRTYLETGHATEIVELPVKGGLTDLAALASLLDESVAAVILQNPNFFGCIEDGPAVRQCLTASASKAILLISVVEPVSLGILSRPGDYGADIVAGEGASLGLGLSFGGPYLGFLACREALLRRMPGRLAGRTVDSEGRTGYVLTLQAREQHIRREKALSNICSNEALCALAATIHLSAIGRQGFRALSDLCFQKAHALREMIAGIGGFKFPFEAPFFNEFVVQCPTGAQELNHRLLDHGILGGYELERKYPELKDCLLFCATETTSQEEMKRLADALRSLGGCHV